MVMIIKITKMMIINMLMIDGDIENDKYSQEDPYAK